MFVAILIVFAVLVVIAAAAGLVVWFRLRKAQTQRQAMEKAITNYFKKVGVSVTVECRAAGKHVHTAYIESEPMKQFRLSHIIENSLRDHLYNLHRLELGKVFWRFPIRHDPTADPAHGAKDEYITEGLAHTRYLPKAEALETSWATFEEAGVGIGGKD